MTHEFRVGDRVRNGASLATVIGLVSDDALRVIYDGDDEETVEVALYFRSADDTLKGGSA